ncbi:hypothetical protein KI387_021898 [Taxus chinensis]|uniref:Uncharacterized protein n=1 Tax=Taxus chinensis TaxID=29808 RepID=A0AA38GEN3_TAXCH|nr:hypothetical protein KI387_021898 [Taxus chinensis]
MEGEKNKGRPVTEDKGKQICTPKNGESDSWILQVEKRFNSGEFERRKTSYGASICRVPESIRSTDKKAYDPVVVSFGPYHQKKHLSAMEDRKLQAVQSILISLHIGDDIGLKNDSEVMMTELIKEISELEDDIRNCYEDSAIEWDSKTLVWMLTMDACFILDFLRKGMPNSIMKREMILDILKLENQIPLCILVKILQLEFKGSQKEVSRFLAELLTDYQYFTGFPFSLSQAREEKNKQPNKQTQSQARDKENKELNKQTQSQAREEENKELNKQRAKSVIDRLINAGKRPYHLLHLCREVIASLLTDSASETTECCSCTVNCGASSCTASPKVITCYWQNVFPCLYQSTVLSSMPSVVKLGRAGINCEPTVDKKVHFKKRSLGRGILFLKPIIVDDSTEIILRNLMAFEECRRVNAIQRKATISQHVCLMDNIIHTQEDVEALVKKNVIVSYMGSDEEVATIFNKICTGITYENTEFGNLLKVVNEHYSFQLNVWRRRLQEDYFSTPWYLISFVAAALLLGMTVVQTFNSFK